MTRATPQDGVPEGHRRCSKCSQIKLLSEFGLDRGRPRNYCKPCMNAMIKAYREMDPERHKRERRDRYKAGGEAAKQKKRNWDRRNMDRIYACKLEREKDPVEKHKLRARKWVSNAVQRGKLPRASTLLCAYCGQPAHGYHHEDYDKPLVVVPVCRDCHRRVHDGSLNQNDHG